MKLTKLEIITILLISVVSIGTFVVSKATAEQSGSTPDSQTASIINDTYGTLVELGYGTEEGANGTLWNRIISSSTWTPSGDVAPNEVLEGKTFYSNSRQQQTGTLELLNYEAMSLQAKDFRDSNASSIWSTWTNTNVSPEVWKDERTGLYWSAKQGATSNNFNMANCEFYSTPSRGDYEGLDADCGGSINICGSLSLDADGDGTLDTGWYLPTQSELMQAYLNGIYLSASADWVTGDPFWSSTEQQANSVNAWITLLDVGYTLNPTKGTSYFVRCVLRHLD